MPTLNFAFRPDLPRPEQIRLLESIRAWPQVDLVDYLVPDSGIPELTGLCFAVVADGADLELVREQLGAIPDVAFVSRSPGRRPG